MRFKNFDTEFLNVSRKGVPLFFESGPKKKGSEATALFVFVNAPFCKKAIVIAFQYATAQLIENEFKWKTL